MSIDYSVQAKKNHLLTTFASLLTLLLFLAGCSTNPKVQQAPIQSEQDYFARSQSAIKAGNYFLAIEQLEKIETHYPFGRYTAQAQLDLVYAYYKSGDYTSAQQTAQRFITQQTDHPERDYAYYMKGLASFDIDRGFLTRILPTTPAQRTMEPVVKAYQDFRKLLREHPDSQYARDAHQRMIYLRNILAAYEIEVGQYYLRRGAYLASIKRGQYVIEKFPESPSVPSALALAAKGYLEVGQKETYQMYLDTLVQNFPDYPELNGEELDYTKQSLREKRSWLNILSFGLVGADGT